MEKDFKKWHSLKELLENKKNKIYFHERDIWWCSLGANIGFEEDGKNDNFERPVIVIKKFNDDLLWILPLTSVEKTGKYYFQVSHGERKSSLILSQMRAISSNRLLRKMRMVSKKDFGEIKKRLRSFL